MRFEDVLSNGTLWATVYDGEKEKQTWILLFSIPFRMLHL